MSLKCHKCHGVSCVSVLVSTWKLSFSWSGTHGQTGVGAVESRDPKQYKVIIPVNAATQSSISTQNVENCVF